MGGSVCGCVWLVCVWGQCVCGSGGGLLVCVGGLLLTQMLSSSFQHSLTRVAASPKLPVPFGALNWSPFLVRKLLG